MRIALLTFALTSFVSANVYALPLENLYLFETAGTVTDDSSGNSRNGTLDGAATFFMDPQRGGTLRTLGGNDGFMRAAVPDLETTGADSSFSLVFWTYWETNTVAGNNGLFQVQNGGTTPSGTKVIGGWVTNSDGDIWGRIINNAGGTSNLPQNNVDQMPVGQWTHVVYRGNGTNTYEVFVDGQPTGVSVGYDGTLNPHDTIIIGKQGSESWPGRFDDFAVFSEGASNIEVAALFSLAMEPGLEYDPGQANQLFEGFDNSTPAVVIDGRLWELVTDGSLSGPEGQVQSSFLGFAINLGNGNGFISIIPEPSSFALLGLGLCGLMRRRRNNNPCNEPRRSPRSS